jgi:hypothetical protein
MAYTQPARLVFALQDSSGVRTSLSVPVLLDPTKTATQLAAAWNTQAALLDAVTGAKILAGEVVIEPVLTFTAKSPSPVAGELMERTGNVDYPYGTLKKLYDSIIPCVDSGILTASGKQINEAATAFVNYIAPFETPPAEWEATNNGFVPFSAAHADSFVSFRKHRRRRHEVSSETP